MGYYQPLARRMKEKSVYILQDALGYAAVKILFKKCSGLKYGLTGLYCVTTADFFQEKKKVSA